MLANSIKHEKFKTLLPALGAIFLWSILAALGVYLSEVPPFFLLGCGFFLGALCGIPAWRQWKVTLPQLALGLYGLLGYHFVLFFALRTGPSLEVNLMNYLWPALVVLLTPVFFADKRLNRRHLFAAAVGFLGALLIVTQGRLSLNIDEGLLGPAMGLVAALIWSTYSLICKRSPFPNGAIGLFCLASSIISFLFHFVLEPTYTFNWGLTGPILFLGLGPMGAAFYLWDRAVKVTDPRVLGGVSYLTPLLSTLFLAFTMAQVPSLFSIVGFILILCGSYLSLKAS